jgi:CBS-domain-containing membrane protein
MQGADMRALNLHHITNPSLPVPGEDPWFANPSDPALSVMTDFRERPSVTVAEIASIDAALDHMKHAGVRSAFVVENARNVVVGLVTAYDIMSEKPMRFMQSLATPRSEVVVRNIMQPIADWRVVDVKDLETSTVSSVASMFEESALTHVPVVERAESGGCQLRGLLSAARVRRLLVR